MALQRRCRIAIEGRADSPGDVGQGHVFRVENAVAIFEMVQGSALTRGGDREGTAGLRLRCFFSVVPAGVFVFSGVLMPGRSRSPLRPQPESATPAGSQRDEEIDCISQQAWNSCPGPEYRPFSSNSSELIPSFQDVVHPESSMLSCGRATRRSACGLRSAPCRRSDVRLATEASTVRTLKDVVGDGRDGCACRSSSESSARSQPLLLGQRHGTAGHVMGIAEGQAGLAHQPVGQIGGGRIARAGGGLHPVGADGHVARPCRSWRQSPVPGFRRRRRPVPCLPACPWNRRAAGPSSRSAARSANR